VTEADSISEKAEYDQHDDAGLEQCPVCGTCLAYSHYRSRVVRPTGLTSATVYEHLLETDPTDGPFYCGECWDSHCTEVRKKTHRTLTEFSTEDSTYYG